MEQSHSEPISATKGVSGRWPWRDGGQAKTSKPDEKNWTGSEKLRILGGGEPPLEGEAFGALLRREGLHEAQVTAWRDAAPGALSNSALRHEFSEAKKRLEDLERELQRKDKALAEAAALLLLEKKLQSIGWHSAAESMDPKSDE